MQARDLMTLNPRVVTAAEPIGRAARIVRNRNVGQANLALKEGGLAPSTEEIPIPARLHRRVPGLRLASTCLAALPLLLLLGCDRGGPIEPEPVTPVYEIAFASNRGGNLDIYVGTDALGVRRLTDDSARDDSPAWSPDRKWIAFDSNRSGTSAIHLMRADGSGVRQLTSGPGSDYSPTWSPDGQRIAFVRYQDDEWEIYSISASGTGLQRLTNWPGADTDPAWGPNGRIAFTRQVDDGTDIFVMNADGSGATRLAVDGRQPSWSPDGSRIAFVTGEHGPWFIRIVPLEGNESVALPALEGASHPTWSPDGRKIVYSAWTREPVSSYHSFSYDLYSINVDGSGRALRLTDAPPQRSFDPDWSRDGDRIAVASQIDNVGSAISILDTSGHEATRLVPEPWPVVYRTPRWSPDGTRLAFHRYGSSPGLYVMTADGREVRRLEVPEGASAPLWSPDGSRIAFHLGGNEPASGELYVINPDGSGLRRLAQGIQPSWFPDGRSLAFVGSDSTYLMVAVEGGEPTQLLSDRTVYLPTLSPDGQRIAFLRRYRADPSTTILDYFFRLYIISSSVAEQQPAEAVADIYFDAARSLRWSPDGSRIAVTYERWRLLGSVGAAVVTIDGGAVMHVFSSSLVSGGALSTPTWAPDGSRFLLSATVRDDPIRIDEVWGPFPYQDQTQPSVVRFTRGERQNYHPAWTQ